MKPSAKGKPARGEAASLAMWGQILDQRPILVAVAGPNGAGKTTFYNAHLRPAGLRFVNADEMARELAIDGYEAARIVAQVRQELVRCRESFVFETVFSDPVGDKLTFLKAAAQAGYTVVLCFIGISGPETSEQRVAMRVSQGGHDVPPEKLVARFPRTMTNLRAAIGELPHVIIFDNDDLSASFQAVAVVHNGRVVWSAHQLPEWLRVYCREINMDKAPNLRASADPLAPALGFFAGQPT